MSVDDLEAQPSLTTAMDMLQTLLSHIQLGVFRSQIGLKIVFNVIDSPQMQNLSSGIVFVSVNLKPTPRGYQACEIHP
jgi:hypothetical protein